MRGVDLLASLPAALRVLTDPVQCGPATIALPQDVSTVAGCKALAAQLADVARENEIVGRFLKLDAARVFCIVDVEIR